MEQFTVRETLLDKQTKQQLLTFTEVGTFVEEVAKQPSSTSILWIQSDNETVGYCVMSERNGREIFDKFIEIDEDDPEHLLELEEFLDYEKEYYYLEYLEIFQPYQQKGYGKEFIQWLKVHYADQRIILYCLFETKVFWDPYIVDEFDDYWLLIA